MLVRGTPIGPFTWPLRGPRRADRRNVMLHAPGALRTPGGPPKRLIGNSRFNKKTYINVKNIKVIYRNFGFKNLGLPLEFRFLVGIGSSGAMIGSLCLNMVLVPSFDQQKQPN